MNGYKQEVDRPRSQKLIITACTLVITACVLFFLYIPVMESNNSFGDTIPSIVFFVILFIAAVTIRRNVKRQPKPFRMVFFQPETWHALYHSNGYILTQHTALLKNLDYQGVALKQIAGENAQRYAYQELWNKILSNTPFQVSELKDVDPDVRKRVEHTVLTLNQLFSYMVAQDRTLGFTNITLPESAADYLFTSENFNYFIQNIYDPAIQTTDDIPEGSSLEWATIKRFDQAFDYRNTETTGSLYNDKISFYASDEMNDLLNAFIQTR